VLVNNYIFQGLAVKHRNKAIERISVLWGIHSMAKESHSP